MRINELVERITQKRKERLPERDDRNKDLDHMLEALEKFDELKDELVDTQGNARDGRYKTIAEKYPEMVIKINALSSGECRRKIAQAKQTCEQARKRFSRESINVAVIGKARVGKSEFLKSKWVVYVPFFSSFEGY